MNQFDETAALIGNEPRLVAVVTRPAAGQFRRDDFGVILLGAGLVHHVGPNRLMTRVARMLAGLGLTCIRFDHRGIGDSAAQASAKPFEVTAVEETIEVMDWFQRTEGLDSFAAVDLAVRRQRHLFNHRDRHRHHVGGQSLAGPIAQLEAQRIGPVDVR